MVVFFGIGIIIGVSVAWDVSKGHPRVPVRAVFVGGVAGGVGTTLIFQIIGALWLRKRPPSDYEGQREGEKVTAEEKPRTLEYGVATEPDPGSLRAWLDAVLT